MKEKKRKLILKSLFALFLDINGNECQMMNIEYIYLFVAGVEKHKR